MINLIIDNQPVSVPEGTTILEAAKQYSIHIPNLCYLEGVHQFGACRICVVKVEGAAKLQAACMAEVREGMVVHTNTDQVRAIRKINYELLLSNHSEDCSVSGSDKQCGLEDLGQHLGVTKARFTGKTTQGIAAITAALTLDRSRCILCRRCVTVCTEGILSAQNRAFDTVIGTAMDQLISTDKCTGCDRCIEVCPVGAIKKV